MTQNHQYDWLGRDWQKLKKQLVRLCVSYAHLLFDDEDVLRTDVAAAMAAFQIAMLTDVGKRILNDKLSMWQEVPALFIDVEPLVGLLTKSGSAKSTVSGNQQLGQSLRYFFEDARRVLVAAEVDDSPSRIKTWERVDRLSRQIATLIDLSVTERCSETHFEAVLQAINTDYPNDYNYPHKLSTIRAYFFKLSHCCRALEEQVDSASLEQHSAIEVNDVLFSGIEKTVLNDCLKNLKEAEFELLDMAFKLGSHDVQYLSEKSYREIKGYTMAEYNRAKRMAMENLAILFEQQYHKENCEALI